MAGELPTREHGLDGAPRLGDCNFFATVVSWSLGSLPETVEIEALKEEIVGLQVSLSTIG